MKQVYICGDSFAVSDIEYGNYTWPEQIAKLSPDVSVINLASVCASNLLISLQIDRAIANGAEYIIVLCTAVTRSEVLFAQTDTSTNLFDRFYNLTNVDSTADLTTYTILNLSTATALTDVQKTLLKQYNKEFFDLELAIYRDRCIIENSLQKLIDSNIPFTFDQGGFEHKSYSAVNNYFIKYNSFKSELNIWDYTTTRTHRPYFHITDQEIHKRIAEYYVNKITKA